MEQQPIQPRACQLAQAVVDGSSDLAGQDTGGQLVHQQKVGAVAAAEPRLGIAIGLRCVQGIDAQLASQRQDIVEGIITDLSCLVADAVSEPELYRAQG
ncbi:hypothetical protein D3C76_992950 [compost metagenome]